MKKDEFFLKYDYRPLFLIIFYLTLSYVIYMYQNNLGTIETLLFLVVVYFSIILGYLFATHSNFTNFIIMETRYKWEYNNYIKKILIFSMLITILTSVNNVTTFYNSISEMFYYITRPGEAYEYVKFLNRYPEYQDISTPINSIVGITFTLLSSTKYIYLTLSLYFWKDLSKTVKLLFLLTSLIYIVNSLLIGAMINIGAMFITVIPVILIKKYRRSIMSSVVNTLIFIILIILLSYMVGSRIVKNVGLIPTINKGMKILLEYISHGYEGLEKSLELSFVPTFGFTTFRGVTSYITEFFGLYDLFNNSYLIRNEMESGWPAMSKWSTIYPWLASDFSFWLIPILMFIIALIFGVLWHKVKVNNNPWGIILLGQFFLFWLMIPANNQIFHTLGNFSAFLLILVLYIVNNRRKKESKYV